MNSMDKKRIVVVGMLVFFVIIFSGRSPTPPEWNNASWHYRVQLDINSSFYERDNWPVEHTINFTKLIDEMNESGTFDNESIRVLEYSSSGYYLHEINSQFDEDDNYDASTNAIGTLSFLMNGSTNVNSVRTFFVYFDVTENGAKAETNYQSFLNYSRNGDEFSVNNSRFEWYVDTKRSDNTSGIYRVSGKTGVTIFNLGTSFRPGEYVEFFNGTDNITYYMENNITLLDSGPIRVKVKLEGVEIAMGNANITTNLSRVEKIYTFYANSSWIKIEQNITNMNNTLITKNSTEAGALAFDAKRAYGAFYSDDFIFTNESAPGSWSMAFAAFGSSVGIVHVNQSISNYSASNSSSLGRIGIQLNNTEIAANESIYELAVMVFNSTDSIQNEMEPLKQTLLEPANITQYTPERWYVNIEPETNYTIHNRGDVILIRSPTNSTSDVNNVTFYVNATLDMGTASGVDDQTLELYDDGTNGDETAYDEVFSRNYTLSTSETLGEWNITVRNYNPDKMFLNESYVGFNVTDIYIMNLTLSNSSVLVSVMVNATFNLTNARNDTYIDGANRSCDINGTNVNNITDAGNGIYNINFTSPSQPGIYTLNCTANKSGNIGSKTDILIVETPTTNISANLTPSSVVITTVTQNISDQFYFEVNMSNIGNATARNTNVTLSLPPNWYANETNITESSCGNINLGENCIRGFNITVQNKTQPDIYNITVTLDWKNADSTFATNYTNMTVNVTSNATINITDILVAGEIADGQEKIFGNFTLISEGNDDLINVTFNVTGLNNFTITFNPVNLSTLVEGQEYPIQVNVTAPIDQPPGIYTGIINVTTANDGYDNLTLQITVPNSTNVSTSLSVTSQIISQITQNSSESFVFTTTSKNVGNATARNTNITLTLPSLWQSNTTNVSCDRLNATMNCISSFNVTVPNQTIPGLYNITVILEWRNPNESLSSNSTNITVNVSNNPVVNVSETNISGNVTDGTEQLLGNITILSIGNYRISNVSFTVIGLDDFTINFTPSNITNLTEATAYPVEVNVTVPQTYLAGTYSGTINITTTDGGGYKNITINVTVPENRIWNATPQECQRVELPDEGSVCNITINNSGNAQINFTVIPNTSGYYSYPENTTFVVSVDSTYILQFLYNVSGVPKDTFIEPFNITPLQSSSPNNVTINISLLPFIQPDPYAYIVPNSTGENITVGIYTNISSATTIEWAQVTITRPDNTVDILYLNNTVTVGEQSTWYLPYPYVNVTTTGNTTQRGVYNVSVLVNDTTGATNTSNTSFNIHVQMNPTLLTQSSEYFQGDIGSVYYKLVDLNIRGIESNVSINITDPNGNITYNTNHVTDNIGLITPQPQFTIPSDAVLGTYNVSAYAYYFDNTTNETVTEVTNTSFVVQASSSGSGIFADLETAVNWFPNNIIKFDFQIYDSSGSLIDPDDMNLTVYDPADNIYFNITMASMTKETTGFYSYDYAMPSSTATGAYLAVLEIERGTLSTQKLKAFRIVSGGPFDLKLTLLENEVYLSDYLDFEVTMINMGEVSQDVIFEYWVTDSSNNTWFYASEALYSASLTNQSVTRSAYIYSSQNLGFHTLHGRLTFDSVQPAATSNVTFNVVQAANESIPEIPPEVIVIGGGESGGGGGGQNEETEIVPFDYTYNITITDYPSQVSLVKGWTGLETIKIKNTGNILLGNISLIVIGIPTPWITIKPEKINELKPAETSVFEVEFNIPKSAEVMDYDIIWFVKADYANDQKSAVLSVFNSQIDLFQEEINRLKQQLNEMKMQTKFAEDIGKDVTDVYTLLEEVTSQIAKAETNLENNMLDEATENIVTASGLLEEAKNLLANAKFRVQYSIETIPFMYILIIIVVLVGVNAFLLIWIKGLNRDVGRLIRPNINKVRELVGVKQKKEEDDVLIRERRKILGVLDILEKEYKDGIISKSAYDELKKNHKKKLKDLNKKLK